MVVLEICEIVSFYGGNFIECLKSLEKQLCKLGENNRVIYAFPLEAKEIGWVKDLGRDGSVFYFNRCRPQYMVDLLKLCSKNHVDIVHLHFSGVVNTLLLQLFSHVKILVHHHNTIDPLPPLKKYIYKIASYRVSKFIGCSHYVMETMLENGFAKEKCMYVTNCIDFKRLDIVHDSNVLSNGKSNLLIFGTDFYRKGVDLVLKALSSIAEKYNLCLQIISHNPKTAEENVKSVLGYFPNWCEINPPVKYIADYYRASEVFLSPSRAEGLSTAVIEAIYCGCLIIKSNVSSMEYGFDNEDIVTVNLDEMDIRNHIESMLNLTSEKKYNIINLFKSQVETMFSSEKWAKEISDLYESTLNNRKDI